MNAKIGWPILAATIALSTVTSTVLVSATANAQGEAAPPSGYRIGDGSDAPPATAPATAASDETADAANKGPVRLTRVSFVNGTVSWRPSDSEKWSAASVNLPIRQGAQIWVTNGGRAELQFDDGAMLRLGSGAIATLTTLYSDTDGEFTEIQLQEGLSTLVLKHAHSIYQVDTPSVSIKSDGPSNVRVGVDSGTEIAVHLGKATVHGSSGTTVVQSGSYLDLASADSPFEVGAIPSLDDWDNWNDARDQALVDDETQTNLPPNIALVAGDLDDYGSWESDPDYGAVWCPKVQDPAWRPYMDGCWTWVEPFGWTWVSSEPWGWAPYHYGTWICKPYGWAWCPGPAHQYWCPAVVHFTECDGAIAWCPLAPHEVHYPPVLSIGFAHGDWSAFFSIGGAACYYPAGAAFCEPRRFDTFVVNHERFGHFTPNIVSIVTGNGPGHGVYTGAFVPFNARAAAGVTVVASASFGEHAQFIAPARAATDLFVRGQSSAAGMGSRTAFSGPASVRPTELSFTPTHSVLVDRHPATELLQRPVVREELPARVSSYAPSNETVRVLPSSQRSGTWGGGQYSTNLSAADRVQAARQEFSGASNRGTNWSNSGGGSAASIGSYSGRSGDQNTQYRGADPTYRSYQGNYGNAAYQRDTTRTYHYSESAGSRPASQPRTNTTTHTENNSHSTNGNGQNH